MPITLDTKASLTLAKLGAGIIAIVGATWWTGRLAAGIEQELAMIRVDLDGKYTLAAASEQALRMAIENPGMRVPDPRDPQQVLVVESAAYKPAMTLPHDLGGYRVDITPDTMPGS